MPTDDFMYRQPLNPEFDMSILRKTAGKLYKENIIVKPNEHIVILTDNGPNRRIGEACYLEALSLYGTKNVEFAEIRNYKERADSSPIPEVPESYYTADVIVAPTWKSVTHSKETKEAIKNGARAATMPGTREYDFIQALSVDAKLIQEIAKYCEKEFKKLNEITVKSPKGTNIKITLDPNGIPLNDNGDFSKPGTYGNVPFGEYALLPIAAECEGKAVFSLSGETHGDCMLYLEEGKIVDWDNNAKPMVDLLHRYDGGDIIAEFASGINPAIKYEPKRPHFDPNNTVVTEKIWKSCHGAFGNDTQFGGKNNAGIHKDVVILKPTFFSNGRKLNFWEGTDRIIKRYQMN